MDILLASYVEDDWTLTDRNKKDGEVNAHMREVDKIIQKHKALDALQEQYYKKDKLFTEKVSKVVSVLKRIKSLTASETRAVQNAEEAIQLLLIHYHHLDSEPFNKRDRDSSLAHLQKQANSLKAIVSKYRSKK